MWNDAAAASALMRDKTRMEEGIKGQQALEQGLDDATALVELGEAEGDEDTAQEGVAELKAIKEASQRMMTAGGFN